MSRLWPSLVVSAAILIELTTSCLNAAAAPIVLSFGANIFGKTGRGTTNGETPIATPITSSNLTGRTIKQLAAGTDHSLLLADDGTVFAFGSNGNGRSGLGSSIGITPIATPIDTTNLSGKAVSQIAAGSQHSLLLAEGSVYAFGWNFSGELGMGPNTIGDRTYIATPIVATNLNGRTITNVATGGHHSLLLADDGTVFSCGSNAFGQAGAGSASIVHIATPIIATNLTGKRIAQISAGEFHSLLLADDGAVFTFGTNSQGQLGRVTGVTGIAQQIDMTNLGNKRVTQVSAGEYFNLLLTEEGSVYSFGLNNDGRNGLGLSSGDTYVATQINPAHLLGKKIVQVSGGHSHGLLLAEDGTIFSFGSNFASMTGIGTNTGNTLIPTPINASNLAGLRVLGFSAGGESHSLILAVPEPCHAGLMVVAGLLGLGSRVRRRPKPRHHDV